VGLLFSDITFPLKLADGEPIELAGTDDRDQMTASTQFFAYSYFSLSWGKAGLPDLLDRTKDPEIVYAEARVLHLLGIYTETTVTAYRRR
jgi:hypothetical protein